MNMSYTLQVGDIIRDVEDGDCYYEGIVVSTNPIQYEITNIVWSGEVESRSNGNVTKLRWWILEVLKDGKFIQVKQ